MCAAGCLQHSVDAGLEGPKDLQQYPWEMRAGFPKCQNQVQWIWVQKIPEGQDS